MFSGGSYEEVARWLWNFLASHAKREDPRLEVEPDSDEKREGRSYGARLRLGGARSTLVELDYREVADHRGELAWCTALATRARALGRELMTAAARSAERVC